MTAILTLLLISIGISHAGVYYVWGPEELEPMWSVLNAIVQFMDSSVFKSALLVFLSLGILMLALGSMGYVRLGTIGWYVLGVLFVHIILYGPRTTVQIHDLTCDGWRTPIDCDRTVDNVPAILGFGLSLMGVLNKLAENIGVTYGSISGGFPSKERCTEALTSLTFNHLRDSQVREDFIAYVDACLVPCTMISPDLWSKIVDSENLLLDLELPPECSFLEIYDATTGSNVSCTNFYTLKISSKLNVDLSLSLDGDWYDKVIARYCSQSPSSLYAYGGKNGLSPDDIARQAILTEGLIVSLQLASEGVEENLKTRMILTNQKQTTRSVMKAMATWLKDVFPMLKAVAQVFVIAFFPFTLLFLLLPISSRAVVIYFMSLLGIAMWTPALAIANAVLNWFGEWQTSVLLYSPAVIYELKDKLYLTGAIGAVAYAIIPALVGVFTGGLGVAIWRGVFGAGSPVHLPETAKHQSADPLGAQKASAELSQRAMYERRGELIPAGMFTGVKEAQSLLTEVKTSADFGVGGVQAGIGLGRGKAFENVWNSYKYAQTVGNFGSLMSDLALHGFRATPASNGNIAVIDSRTGNVLGYVDPASGMAQVARPDLALGANLQSNLQRITSEVANENLSKAYAIAYAKEFSHNRDYGIDKTSQALESYANTKAGAEYRQFVSSIANQTQSSEQDVHRAMSAIHAFAGADGRLTANEAQSAVKWAMERFGKNSGVVRAMKGILGTLGLGVSGQVRGEGTSESGHTSEFTVTSSQGDNYTVSFSNSDEWRKLTQTTLSALSRHSEGWSEREKEDFNRSLSVANSLLRSENVSETLGIGGSVNLDRDIQEWAVQKYGWGGFFDKLRTAEGRMELLKGYIGDKAGSLAPGISGVVAKERVLSSLGVNYAQAWGEFSRNPDNTAPLKRVGLTDDQIAGIQEKLTGGDRKGAYALYLDSLVQSQMKDAQSRVDGQVGEVERAPEKLKGLESMDVEGVDRSRVESNIDAYKSKVDSGKQDLNLPSSDNARREASLMEALKHTPSVAVASGAIMGLTSLAHGIDFLRERFGKNGNILDDLFTKEEQVKLRDLRTRAVQGDVRASQEYLEMWQKRMSELEKADPIKAQKVRMAMQEMENIMDNRGVLSKIREVVSDIADKAPQYARRLGGVLGEATKALGVADLLADSSPAFAPTVVTDRDGYVYSERTLANAGLIIDNQGNLRISDNLTPEQREILARYGVDAHPKSTNHYNSIFIFPSTYCLTRVAMRVW